jgi:hypothetical protein
MGQGGVEHPTSRLSGVRSNHLSYWPYQKKIGKAIDIFAYTDSLED